MAFSAGFSGQRALQTWEARLRILSELQFILVKPGPSGPLSYALVLNPYRVIKTLRKKHRDTFPEDIYNSLVERALEIGARDLEDAPVAQEI